MHVRVFRSAADLWTKLAVMAGAMLAPSACCDSALTANDTNPENGCPAGTFFPFSGSDTANGTRDQPSATHDIKG